jgi:peptide/nickel transport system substrate-binding protein
MVREAPARSGDRVDMGRSSAASLHRKEGPKRDQLKGWPLQVACAILCVVLGGCGNVKRGPGEIVFLIDTNPANLDPRFATDGQSQRIDALIFDGLLERDAEMNLHGDLAESWETPNPLTYVFHLREGVRFHDGRPVTAADVKATFEYMMDAGNRSPKRGAFRMVARVEAPDARTVIFRLKEPAAAFPLNTIRGVVGIVPADAGSDVRKKMIGSGAFRFVSQAQDDAVVLERNGDWGGRQFTVNSSQLLVSEGKEDPRGKEPFKVQSLKLKGSDSEKSDPGEEEEVGRPSIVGESADRVGVVVEGVKAAASRCPPEKVTFRIVPDAIVRALELRKGSADVEMSSLSPDMIPVLAKQKDLLVSERPGTNYGYLGINFEDAVLAHREVRQALAYATDRESLVKYLLRGEAQLASGILPPNHWAYEGDVRKYGYHPGQAEKLLDAAGFARGADGVRFRVTLKVSTQEQARLIGAVLQDQWKKVGVALEVRPLEAATLFADLAKGNFQLSYSNWVGANTDPDVLGLVFSSKRFPPDGANRGHYRNARVDELTAAIAGEMDQGKRKALSSEVQKIVAEDVPYVSLWYVDVVSVHRKELGEIELTHTGEYGFLMGKEGR